jgi:hypothetical protein
MEINKTIRQIQDILEAHGRLYSAIDDFLENVMSEPARKELIEALKVSENLLKETE